ncbi:hypothetical protein GIS00_15970 [Nakamurella sp. YIM 132087]|uniref:Uncharacterized protein n=1 Tax=Nakamurella alba TaxID=2665158 RepID=A0A7K1FMP0_9ACTN|nr:hypothetical protein [Nakamurella alba]MTD15435.1 hypothetical protein [Nakamurella alba]
MIRHGRAGEALIVSIGNITWAVFDQLAMRDQVAIWTHLRDLAPLILPEEYVRERGSWWPATWSRRRGP